MDGASITYGGQGLFGRGVHTLEVDSWQRESVDRGFAGLDGTISLDLGRRKRAIRQRGYLVAESRAELTKLVGAIQACIDGETRELVDADGQRYGEVRMDQFKQMGTVKMGSHVRCDYEIRYMQLGE